MLRSVVAALCDGLVAVVEQRFDDAVRLIRPLLRRLTPIGGSLAVRSGATSRARTPQHACIRAAASASVLYVVDSRAGQGCRG